MTLAAPWTALLEWRDLQLVQEQFIDREREKCPYCGAGLPSPPVLARHIEMNHPTG